MSRSKKKNRISVGGNLPRPGQTAPRTIVLTQPKRFRIDMGDVITGIRAAENVDYSRRYKLYDLFSDILMDSHLSCVIDKRMNAVLGTDIEFRRKGNPDDVINEQLRSPWFRRLIRDIMGAQFWGFSLLQFYKDGQWINYDLIPRKHADPVRRLILRHQTDITGTSWDEYADLLFVGDPEGLGLLSKAAPWVIYKRNTTADWANFSEVFGMPIREYLYDTDDDEARQRALDDASEEGSLSVIVHSKDNEFKLIESGSKTGSAELYERLCERCNNELSKLILGNTLTTESSTNGTQALGTVHKKVEDKVAQSDRRFILNVLNYEMTDLLLKLGLDTTGGEFYYPEPKDVDMASKMSILSQLRTNFNLPISDDYLYNEFGIEKPENYSELKKEGPRKEKETLTPAPLKSLMTARKQTKKGSSPRNIQKRPWFKNLLSRFFVKASRGGAALKW